MNIVFSDWERSSGTDRLLFYSTDDFPEHPIEKTYGDDWRLV